MIKMRREAFVDEVVVDALAVVELMAFLWGVS
jgi:hypothetical protein